MMPPKIVQKRPGELPGRCDGYPLPLSNLWIVRVE